MAHTGTMSDAADADETPFDRRIGRRDVTRWRTATGRRLASTHQSIADRIGAHRTLVATLAIGGTVAVAATVGATRIYDGVTGRDGIASLDGPALKLAKTLRSPAANAAAAIVARAFGPVSMPILTVAAATALAVRQRHVSPLTLLAAAGAGSLAMTVAGKNIIDRNRPHRRDAVAPYEKSPSFPSGHTLNATAILGTLAYLLSLQTKRDAPQAAIIGAAAATTVTVGLSRVLLGAHWLTDVVVGWTTGTGWLALLITSHRLYLTSKSDDR